MGSIPSWPTAVECLKKERRRRSKSERRKRQRKTETTFSVVGARVPCSPAKLLPGSHKRELEKAK